MAQAEKNARVSLIGDIGDALGTLSEIAGKQTVAGKALAVAQATITAIQGAINSYTSLSSIPIVGPELGAIAAAGALVAGYANIKKILAVQVPGSGGSSTGSVPGGSSSYTAPTVVTTANATNLSADSIAQINQKQSDITVKAIVVESDITAAQNRITGYKQASDF